MDKAGRCAGLRETKYRARITHGWKSIPIEFDDYM